MTVSHFSARAIPRPRAARAVPVQLVNTIPDGRIAEERDANEVVALARDPDPVLAETGPPDPLHELIEGLGDVRDRRGDVLDGLFAQPPGLHVLVGVGISVERQYLYPFAAHP